MGIKVFISYSYDDHYEAEATRLRSIVTGAVRPVRWLIGRGIGSGKTNLVHTWWRCWHRTRADNKSTPWLETFTRRKESAGYLRLLLDGLPDGKPLRNSLLYHWHDMDWAAPRRPTEKVRHGPTEEDEGDKDRNRIYRLIEDAMTLFTHASPRHSVESFSAWSALVHESAHTLITEIAANPDFWLAQKGRRPIASQTYHGEFRQILLSQGVFLANRILTYPLDRHARYTDGIEAIGGLVKVAKIAWRAIQFSWSPPQLTRPRYDSGDQGTFSLATTILETFHVDWLETLDTDIPACLIETRGRKAIYLDRNLRWRQKTFAVLHELGHVLLSHADASSSILQEDDIDLSLHEEQESAADAFADVLLHLLEGVTQLVDAVKKFREEVSELNSGETARIKSGFAVQRPACRTQPLHGSHGKMPDTSSVNGVAVSRRSDAYSQPSLLNDLASSRKTGILTARSCCDQNTPMFAALLADCMSSNRFAPVTTQSALGHTSAVKTDQAPEGKLHNTLREVLIRTPGPQAQMDWYTQAGPDESSPRPEAGNAVLANVEFLRKRQEEIDTPLT